MTPVVSWATQAVTDPSNLRPVIACAIIGLALLGLFFVARARTVVDAVVKRRRMYCKAGSFTAASQLPDIPSDVRVVTGVCLPFLASPLLRALMQTRVVVDLVVERCRFGSSLPRT